MENSYKVLVILLSIAILSTAATTILGFDTNFVTDLSRDFDLVNDFGRLTAYSSSGFVNVTISNITAINLTTTDCNFGSGYITVGQTNATLESNGTIANWAGGSGTSASIDVRNDGNWNITLNVSSGKTLVGFYGVDCHGAGAGCVYNFWSTNNETNACTSGLVAWPGTVMDTNNKTVCTNLQDDDVNDEVNVICRLAIYQTVPTGAKTDTWTFWATNH